MKNQYVLRERDDEELSRLKFQHEVWKEETNFAIQKAGINPMDQLMDLGCGPGYLSYDLSVLTRRKGKVYSLDSYDHFIDFIQSQKIENIEAIRADIRSDLSTISIPSAMNKIFCRWVLMFLPGVEKIIEEVYALLADGGKFVSLEYFKFNQIDMFPASVHFTHIYQNVQKLLILNGGNPNIGSQIPEIMQTKGFRNIQTYPIYRTGGVGSPLWNWLEHTNSNHRNLVANHLITKTELQLYDEDWKEKSLCDYAFITAPPLMITIGEK
jgi:SAM-dependent methyltransferase